MSIFDDIRGLKERHQYDEAWKICSQAQEADPSNIFLTTSLYWIAYAAIKDITEKAAMRSDIYLTGTEESRIDQWMAEINRLSLLEKNTDLQFTYLFVLFKKIKCVTSELARFVTTNGSAVFSERDHEPFLTGEGESPSLVLWLARTIVSYANSDADANYKRVHALALYALNNARDSHKGKLWLKKDLIAFYMLLGLTDKARSYALDVLKVKKSEGWAWYELAETYASEPTSAAKLYAKSILLSREDSFKLPALKGLLRLKAMESEKWLANLLINKIISVYESNGWPLKEDVLDYKEASWFLPSSDNSGLKNYMEELAEGAESLAIANLEVRKGIVSGVHLSGRQIFIYVERNIQVKLEKGVFIDKKLPEIGAFVEMSGDFTSKRPFIISAKPTDFAKLDDIGCYAGNVKLAGSPDKPLGFVNDIFVPAHLLTSLKHNDEVSGMYLIAFDKKKERYGKKAFILSKVERNDD